MPLRPNRRYLIRPPKEGPDLGRANGRVTETPGGGVENPVPKNEVGLDTCREIVNGGIGLEVEVLTKVDSHGRDGP